MRTPERENPRLGPGVAANKQSTAQQSVPQNAGPAKGRDGGEPLTPDWLPRRERRAVERQLRKLVRRDECSVCDKYIKHNSRVTIGYDTLGNVIVAGECCAHLVVEIFWLGQMFGRKYDFLPKSGGVTFITTDLTDAQIAEKIATTQKLIEEVDTLIAGAEQRGGVGPLGNANFNLLDSPWKDDDRAWFKRNPSRAHRMRLAYSGEHELETTKTAPAGHTRIMLVRQVEPGQRVKNDFYINNKLLPLPDAEGVAHGLFELAVRHEPMPQDGQQLYDLFEKYTVHGGPSC
jgi:hypothetical protein